MEPTLHTPPIEWESPWLPPDGRQDELEGVVRRDYTLLQLHDPATLTFHHIALTADDEHGPCVFVYGKVTSDALFCRYDPLPQWETLDGAKLDGYT